MLDRLRKIMDEYRQWREEGDHFGDYFDNMLRILLGKEPIDYRVISHDNIIVKSEFLFPLDNLKRYEDLIDERNCSREETALDNLKRHDK